MAIKKTASGTYEARWRPPGSRVVKSKRFKLKKDAVAFMAKVESAKRDGTYTDLTRGKQTLEEWWREYFAYALHLRPSTRRNYRRPAELHILPYLGKRRLGTITQGEWLRIGEAIALRVQNVDLLRGRVQIVEAFAELSAGLVLGETKSGTRRAVTLSKLVRDALREHLEKYPSKDLVFTTPTGEPLRRGNFRGRVWLPAVEKAGH